MDGKGMTPRSIKRDQQITPRKSGEKDKGRVGAKKKSSAQTMKLVKGDRAGASIGGRGRRQNAKNEERERRRARDDKFDLGGDHGHIVSICQIDVFALSTSLAFPCPVLPC
jgi:hypothetical protein